MKSTLPAALSPSMLTTSDAEIVCVGAVSVTKVKEAPEPLLMMYLLAALPERVTAATILFVALDREHTEKFMLDPEALKTVRLLVAVSRM